MKRVVSQPSALTWQFHPSATRNSPQKTQGRSTPWSGYVSILFWSHLVWHSLHCHCPGKVDWICTGSWNSPTGGVLCVFWESIYRWVFPEMRYTKFLTTSCMLHLLESYPNHTRESYHESYPWFWSHVLKHPGYYYGIGKSWWSLFCGSKLGVYVYLLACWPCLSGYGRSQGCQRMSPDDLTRCASFLLCIWQRSVLLFFAATVSCRVIPQIIPKPRFAVPWPGRPLQKTGPNRQLGVGESPLI